MYAKRAPDESIDRYSGPYERWVFSDELGRPFAFPSIAGESSGYYTALLEGGKLPESDANLTIRKPPIWNPLGRDLSITPFAFHDTSANAPRRKVQADKEIARLLDSVRKKHESIPSADASSEEMSPRFRVNFPIVPETWTPNYIGEASPENWEPPTEKPKAIVAVIDDGIPFAHRAFLDSIGRTKVSHCWLQSGLALQQANVPFGREFVNADIDELRLTAGNDDARLYREARALDPGLAELGNHLRRHATHGSHIMGIAAGNASLFPDHEIGDDVQIIAVQLPNTIAWDTSGFGKEMYMLSALHYVFDRASRIAKHYDEEELPLITNFSYGWSASRHDGESEMEIAIQHLLEDRCCLQPLTALTMPSGNNHASYMHASLADWDFTQNEAEIGWQLQPDDKTSSYMELWFPRDFDPTGYSITLVSPHDTVLENADSIEISADPSHDDSGGGDPRRFIELEMDGTNIGQLSADKHRNNRWRVMLALIPTTFVRGQDRCAPSGLWKVKLSRNDAAQVLGMDQDVQIWLQRDDDPSDLKTQGRQSRLVDLHGKTKEPKPTQQYGTQLGVVRGYGSLNGVASSELTTRVSGYVQCSQRPTPYSGTGGVRQTPDGTTAPWGQQADIAAVADYGIVSPGISSIGVLSGARARLVGTSAAAPTVARLMTLNAAAGRPLRDGMASALGLSANEIQDSAVWVQHAARVGGATAPPVIKMG